MITIKNISKRFGGIHANRDISLRFPQGKITALIGPNGCGKTTLFNIIAGSLRQDSGSVCIDDVDMSHSFTYKRGRKISRVFQRASLFDNMTVFENLSLAEHPFSFFRSFSVKKYDVTSILKKIGLLNKKDVLCRDLSYGQKRLVEIARAVLQPHAVLLLDEPIAGVTPSMRKKISYLLVSLRDEGETIVLIEHDLDFAAIADKVVLMGNGKVILEDSYKAVMKHKSLHETYFGCRNIKFCVKFVIYCNFFQTILHYNTLC
ncbi:MAG: ABC transporter ATP-binding protein [Candidatus Woesearchaeota archaeon]